jgi:hypothetical protein
LIIEDGLGTKTERVGVLCAFLIEKEQLFISSDF